MDLRLHGSIPTDGTLHTIVPVAHNTRRATRKHLFAEDRLCVTLAKLRGEEIIAELCHLEPATIPVHSQM